MFRSLTATSSSTQQNVQSNTSTQQTVNLNPLSSSTTDLAVEPTDEDSELDDILNNPPDSFDLVEMFRD